MLIPIRCFTCGNVIADKWEPFIKQCIEKKKLSKETNTNSELDIEYISIDQKNKKSIEGLVLDSLDLHRYCCRRMFLGNVHLISYI
jgi:DNA-directed RNA polymerase subunit N